MPEKISALPILLKIFVAIVSALFSLVLGGYITKDGHLKVKNKHFYITFLSAICVSLFGGSFLIEHFNLAHYSELSKAFINFMVGVFGFMMIGILYRSFQLTFTDKTLIEIIQEVKQALNAILK